jgi:DNA polymerase-3 subunit beta
MLSNVLLRSKGFGMTITATDLELELVARIETVVETAGEITLPARKLLDICRALPDDAEIQVNVSNGKAIIRALRSRFVLATLPANDFPVIEDIQGDRTITVTQANLKWLIDRTAFAMAQQDVRYYLNGLLLHVENGLLRTVATDGHRLAMCELSTEVQSEAIYQVIIPRKAVHELQRLLSESDHTIELELSTNHIRIDVENLRFTSKLIDGRFPDYERVLPKDCDKAVFIDREALRQALTRTAILSSEKYRGVRLSLDGPSMKLQSHNPDQEEAEEVVEIDYASEPLEIGFNVTYLLDVLNVIDSESIEIKFKDASSSAMLKIPNSDQALYVVMPMRL